MVSKKMYYNVFDKRDAWIESCPYRSLWMAVLRCAVYDYIYGHFARNKYEASNSKSAKAWIMASSDVFPSADTICDFLDVDKDQLIKRADGIISYHKSINKRPRLNDYV